MLINQKVLFTELECKSIINLSKTEIRYWNTTDYEYHSMGILYSKDTKWLFDRLTQYFVEQTGNQLIKLKEDIHFHMFKEGDRFEKHNDAKRNRIYGVGVLLNEEFMGGDFIFYDKNPEIINKIKDNSYVFDVITNHEIKPIINGIRYSLLWFLDNNNIKISKTNLL